MKTTIAFCFLIALISSERAYRAIQPYGSLGGNWEDLGNVGVNTPWGGLNVGWKKTVADYL